MKLTILGVVFNSIIVFAILFFFLSDLFINGTLELSVFFFVFLTVMGFSLLSILFLAKVLLIERSNNSASFSNIDLLDDEMAEGKENDTPGTNGEYIMTALRKSVFAVTTFKVLFVLLVGSGFLFDLSDGGTITSSEKPLVAFICIYFVDALIMISKLRSPQFKSI